MNKKTIVAALGLCAIVATPAFAQQADNNVNNCPLNREARGECKERKAPCPFDGLNLTADQKTKLEELKKECKAARDAKKQEFKKNRKALSDAAKADASKARTEELAKIKEILTPEQYVKFLENSYLMKGKRGGKDGKFNKNNRGRHGDRNPQRGNRPAPQPRN